MRENLNAVPPIDVPSAQLPAKRSFDRQCQNYVWGVLACWFLTQFAAGFLAAEPTGPASLASSVVISEVMYHPPSRIDPQTGASLDLEYIELHNTSPLPQQIGRWQLTGEIEYTFSPGTIFAAGGFMILARRPSDIWKAYGVPATGGPYTRRLSNERGLVQLVNAKGVVMAEARYDSVTPWPVAADGAGHSLVLAQPSYGGTDVRAWALSAKPGGSPGGPEPAADERWRPVIINELVARPRAPNLDFVELFNRSASEVNITGCRLADDYGEVGFVFPPETVIAPGSFLVLDEYTLPFGLSDQGETIYLLSPFGQVLDAVRFPAQAFDTSWGRFPDGGLNWTELADPSPYAPNVQPMRRPVVINEIMYAPASGEFDDQYVELFNSDSNTVDVSGWILEDAIYFVLPENTRIPGGGYLVITRNAGRLWARNPSLTPVHFVESSWLELPRTGGRLVLKRLETTITTNQFDVISVDHRYLPADEVSYGRGGAVGYWSEGRGSSLELIDPRAENNLAANWADSDNSMTAKWHSVTLMPEWRQGSGPKDLLEILMLGPGECLLDEVQLIGEDGQNLLPDSSFEESGSEWQAEGTHTAARVELEHSPGEHVLHLKATAAGDPEFNHLRARLLRPLNLEAITLRLRAKWVRGCSRLLIRLGGNWFECVVPLPVPGQLGSPGFQNTRWVSNAPPAIMDLSHTPILPAAGQAVTIRVRVQDPDSVAAVMLNYRVDPGSNWVNVAMQPEGKILDPWWTANSNAGGSGVYQVDIPGQSAGALVAFYLEAVDGQGQQAVFSGPAIPCLVRFGDTNPADELTDYRVWMMESTRQALTNRHARDRQPLPVTFVGGMQQVIHQAGIVPLVSGTNTLIRRGGCTGFKLTFPPNDPFLGSQSLLLDRPGGSAPDATLLQEKLVAWCAEHVGFLTGYRRFVRLHVDDLTAEPIGSVFESVAQPSEWTYAQAGNTNCHLFEASATWERDAQGNLSPATETTLALATNHSGAIDMGRYRWHWRQYNEGPGSDDALFVEMLKTLHGVGREHLLERTRRLMDWDQWCATIAMENVFNNAEAYGHAGSSAVVAQRSADGRWNLLSASWNQAMLLSLAEGFGSNSPLFLLQDEELRRWFAVPAIRRELWYQTSRIVYESLNVAEHYVTTWHEWLRRQVLSPLDTRLADPEQLLAWLQARRVYLRGELERYSVPFTMATNVYSLQSSNLLVLAGTAPPGVREILVNGAHLGVTWTTETNWETKVTLTATQTVLQVTAQYSTAPVSLWATAQCTAPIIAPQGVVFINEIMYSPAVGPEFAYVELVNTATSMTFNLESWRLIMPSGEEIVFGEGARLLPGQFAVVVADSFAFIRVHGAETPIIGEFKGPLDDKGGVMTLSDGLANPVDQVRYAAGLPWSVLAAGSGTALQRISLGEDGSRPVNWGTGVPTATPGMPNSTTNHSTALPPVWINELVMINTNNFCDGFGQNDPWIELYNAGTATVHLAQFALADSTNIASAWRFPHTANLAPGEFRVIWVDGQDDQSSSNQWHTNFRLGPAPGSLYLYWFTEGRWETLDYVNYMPFESGLALCSVPDGQAISRAIIQPSPGLPNVGRVLINEWMADNSHTLDDPDEYDLNYEDWFELYNTSDFDVDLSGYYLTDTLTPGSEWQIPPGSIVKAHGFLLVWADGDTELNEGTSGDLHTSFQLSRSGECIRLLSPGKLVIDQVEFGRQITDVSQGRCPDGSEHIVSMRYPTPRQPNSTNTPPRFVSGLPSLAMAGQELKRQLAAVDEESAPAALTFNIEPGSPPGAQIQPNSGFFTWTPTLDQTNQIQKIILCVTDDGQPPLSTTNICPVLVIPPVTVQARLHSGKPELVAGPLSGLYPRWEYTTNLRTGEWLVEQPTWSQENYFYLTIPTNAGPQRFYRLFIGN